MRDQLLVVTGVPEVRQLKDMIPEILKQVGPKQYDQIKGLLAGEHAVKPTAAVAEDDDDDVTRRDKEKRKNIGKGERRAIE